MQLLGEIMVSAMDRGMADQALRESAARLSLAVDSAEAGLWELDRRTNMIWASDRARLIFGYDPEENISMGRFEGSVHPNDLERVRNTIARTLKHMEPVDVEYRIAIGDGRLKWIAAQGRPHFDAMGELDRILGIAIDISGRKQIEAELNDRLNDGYATAWFGKNHNTPAFEASQAGPFDKWPIGLGFEYFYGFVGGDGVAIAAHSPLIARRHLP